MKEEYLRYADQQHAEALARLEYTTNLARGGLQSGLVANGGALIGLFTLIAPHRDLASSLWPSGCAFSLGLLLTLAAWLFATFGQDRLQVSSTYRSWNSEARARGREPAYDADGEAFRGNRCIYAAYGIVTLAVLAFTAGCLLTLHALA